MTVLNSSFENNPGFDNFGGIEDKCPQIFDFYTVYVEKGIAIVGIIGNLVSMLIFMNKRIHIHNLSAIVNSANSQSNCSMYKYLALKSMFDCIFLFQIITYSLLECDRDHDELVGDDYSSPDDKCTTASHFFKSNYPSKLFNLIFTYYFGFICQLGSMFLEVAATFDRYFIISRKTQGASPSARSSHMVVCLLILLYSALFYVYKPFELEIRQVVQPRKAGGVVVPPVDLTATVHYYLSPSNFSRTHISKGFNLAHTIVRDGVCVLLLLIGNIMILVKLRNALNKKKVIKTLVLQTANLHAQRRKSRKDSIFNTIGALYYNMNKNELRLTLMVVLIGLVNIIGHLPILIFYFQLMGHRIFESYCFLTVKSLLYYLSFSINILFYYFFNKNFSRIFNNLFCIRSQDTSLQISLLPNVPV